MIKFRVEIMMGRNGIQYSKRLAGCRIFKIPTIIALKGIVSPDWKGLQMVSLDRFEV
jgi:hypothetical protein